MFNSDITVAKAIFSPGVAVHLFYYGTDKYLAGKHFPGVLAEERGLATHRGAFCRSLDHGVFLGDVEFLFLSQMDLFNSIRKLLPHF